MSDIDWPLTEDAMLAVLKDKVNEHHLLLRGNGKEGLVDFVIGLKSTMKTVVYLLIFLNALAILALGMFGLIVSHHADIIAPNSFFTHEQMDAHNQIDAGNFPRVP